MQQAPSLSPNPISFARPFSEGFNMKDARISLFACWFQPELISQPTMFSSHNKPAPAGLISLETNQRTG